jgi:hypothetical protein
MEKQVCLQASNHYGLAAMTRVYARGGEDPNGGPHRHLSSGQGSGSLHQPRVGLDRGSSGHTPKHATTIHRWDGQAIAPVGGDPCHRRSTNSEVRPLAPVRVNI